MLFAQQNPEQIVNELQSNFPRILFTGPSGWLGREILDFLNAGGISSSKLDFTFCGSAEKIFRFNNAAFKQVELLSIDEKSKFDLIIHCSFLTQDKMKDLNRKQFREINQAITNKVAAIFNNGRPRLLAISSGAADSGVLQRSKSESLIEYGLLKKEMENAFTDIDDSRALISRVWNVSGGNILEPLKYALGDFVFKAKRGLDIELNSNGKHKRSYIPANMLFANLFTQLNNQVHGVFDSGGVECSILELAQLAQEVLNNESGKVHVLETALDQDDYVSPGSILKTSELIREFPALNLREQILLTSRAESCKV